MLQDKIETICFFFLLVAIVAASLSTHAMLEKNSTKVSLSQLSFAAAGSPTYQVTVNPPRLQEGFNTTITVESRDETSNATVTLNVTDPSGASYAETLYITINGTGFGSNSTQYWGNFSGGANTQYLGLYTVTVNETLASANFTVSLTDKPEYRRTETVSIRAVGYQPNENVTINLRIGNASVAGYPKTLLANENGVLTDAWMIPSDAKPGTYRVSLFNATQTVKSPADDDTFTVLGAVCSIKTVNLANQTVADAVVEVWNATTNQYLNLQGKTNSSGLTQFTLDLGNYTFKAFFKQVEVGNLPNQSVTEDATFTMRLRLVNFVASVETEAGEGVPLIEIAISETASALTNLTGMAEVHNLLTNTTYRVEAKRHGLLFNSTTLTVEFSPLSPWVSLNLILPTYRLNVHTLDSKNMPAIGIQLKIYEWISGVTTPLQSLDTLSSGDASFSLLFGRYRIRAYRGDDFLGQAIVNLVEHPLEFTFNLITANVDITVSVLDYFGQPIANAEVNIERKIGEEYVFAYSQFTGADGSTIFASSVGGDSRISVYVGGKLVAVKAKFLSGTQSSVEFRVGEYVAILGYPMPAGLFALLVFFVLVIVMVLVLERGRLTKALGKKRRR